MAEERFAMPEDMPGDMPDFVREAEEAVVVIGLIVMLIIGRCHALFKCERVCNLCFTVGLYDFQITA